jgi:hypothetical protein
MGLISRVLFDIVYDWFHGRFFDSAAASTMQIAVPERRPRRNVFQSAYAWLVWLCLKLIWGMVGLGMLRLWSLYDTARFNADAEIVNALKGVNNSRCDGEVAKEQRKLCDAYDDTLSRWYVTLVARNMHKIIPSCVVMECGDMWNDISNSYAAWSIWIISMIVVTVWIIQLGYWVANCCGNLTTRERIRATRQDQEYYQNHLGPVIRQVLDEPLRINSASAAAARHGADAHHLLLPLTDHASAARRRRMSD